MSMLSKITKVFPFKRTIHFEIMKDLLDFLDKKNVNYKLSDLNIKEDIYLDIYFSDENGLDFAKRFEYACYIKTLSTQEEKKISLGQCIKSLRLEGDHQKEFIKLAGFELLAPLNPLSVK